jgi:hypothetical protein
VVGWDADRDCRGPEVVGWDADRDCCGTELDGWDADPDCWDAELDGCGLTGLDIVNWPPPGQFRHSFMLLVKSVAMDCVAPSSGISSQHTMYSGMPTPPTIERTANAMRTSSVSTPRYAAIPDATPASIRSSRRLVRLRDLAGPTAARLAGWVLWSSCGGVVVFMALSLPGLVDPAYWEEP